MAVIDSTAVAARSRRRRKRGLRMLLVAAVGVTSAIALTAGTASAAHTCSNNSERHICLAVDGVGGGNFAVHVDIDLLMSAADAQEFIDDPGDPFVVTIVADDGIDTSCPIVCGTVVPTLFHMPMSLLTASNEHGLSGNFDLTVPGSWLNEDPPGQEDEIRAYIQVWDRDTNRMIHSYYSNQLSGNWP